MDFSLDACRSKCISYVLRCALARRLSIQMHLLCAQRRSRSTPIDPNAFPVCSNVLSLDACRSKCVSNVLKCALARRLSIQMHLPCARMRSPSTPVDPNAFPVCSDVLSLDACRSKCISYVLRCAFKRYQKCPCPSGTKKVNPFL